MQKILIAALLIFLGCSQKSDLQRLNIAYPNAVIGDDYGVLALADLAVNTCNVIGNNPYPPKGASAHRYWQCFLTKDVAISCDEGEDKGFPFIMGLEAKDNTENQVYLSRQVIDLARCTEFQNDLKRLSAQETHICISGEFIKNESSNKRTTWIFDKFKTKKGCVSYWDECDLKEEIAKGCIPITPKE